MAFALRDNVNLKPIRSKSSGLNEPISCSPGGRIESPSVVICKLLRRHTPLDTSLCTQSTFKADKCDPRSAIVSMTYYDILCCSNIIGSSKNLRLNSRVSYSSVYHPVIFCFSLKSQSSSVIVQKQIMNLNEN